MGEHHDANEFEEGSRDEGEGQEEIQRINGFAKSLSIEDLKSGT